MSVVIKTLSDIVALVLQAFRLSAVLPAIIFVGLNLVFIVTQFEKTVLSMLISQTDISAATITLICIVIIAYGLSVFNIPIIRFFEGYPLYTLPFVGQALRNSHFRRVMYLQQQISQIEQNIGRILHTKQEAIQKLKDAQNDEVAYSLSNVLRSATQRVRALEMKKNLLTSELSWTYPHHQTWRILPTKLGNVIASAEEFPGHLYGIDSVTFWPFLSPILSETGHASFVEREKASLDFLLNMAVLTLLFGFEIIFIDVLFDRWFRLVTVFNIFVIVIMFSFFYFASIQGALGWGYTIRSSFVLYRHHLRARLGLRSPKGFYEERIMWKKAARFFRDHEITPGRYIFEYPPTHIDVDPKNS